MKTSRLILHDGSMITYGIKTYRCGTRMWFRTDYAHPMFAKAILEQHTGFHGTYYGGGKFYKAGIK